MGFIDTVIKFIVKKFWPWFKEFVWPYVNRRSTAVGTFWSLERRKLLKYRGRTSGKLKNL